MTSKEKALNMLGLAMRAGKLVTGEDLSLKEIQRERAKLVLIAGDASEGTQKRMSDKCSYYEVPYAVTFTTPELSHAIGRERVICTVTDGGFAKKLKELLEI